MKHLKLFEGYFTEPMKKVKDKFKKLKEFVDFIEKYGLVYFIMSIDDNDYHFESLYNKDNKYYLVYEDDDPESDIFDTEITELNNHVVDSLYNVAKKEGRFDVEFQLMTIGDIKLFINVLKIHKDPLNFNEYMFSSLSESDDDDEMSTFEFQDEVFKTHPEAFNSFMEESLDAKERAKEYNFTPIKLHPRIKKKYKNLYDDWEANDEAKKFNM